MADATTDVVFCSVKGAHPLQMPVTSTMTSSCEDVDRDTPRKRPRIVPKNWTKFRSILPQSRHVSRNKQPRSESEPANVFRFMDLPAEIRLMIYEVILIKEPNSNDKEGIVDVCGVDFWDRPPWGEFHLWTHPILRTSSQVRREGLDIFFTKNTFNFDNEFNMNLFLNVIGEFGRERIRSACIGRLPRLWHGEATYSTHEWTRVENYLRMLGRLKNIRHLKVKRSPFYFQERSFDDEDTWYPNIDSLIIEDALRSAYIGPLLQLRGLKSFTLDWSHLDDFEPIQKAWFQEVEKRVRDAVLQPKPENYHGRGRFIYKGYEDQSYVKFVRRVSFYAEKTCPRALSYAIRRPSDFFSTFAYDPERYERQQRWHNRRQKAKEVCSDIWWDCRHPKYFFRRLRWKRGSSWSESSSIAGFPPPILPFNGPHSQYQHQLIPPPPPLPPPPHSVPAVLPTSPPPLPTPAPCTSDQRADSVEPEAAGHAEAIREETGIIHSPLADAISDRIADIRDLRTFPGSELDLSNFDAAWNVPAWLQAIDLDVVN